jgi:hypothetical protein
MRAGARVVTARQTPNRILSVAGGSVVVGSIIERHGSFVAYEASGAVVGKYESQTEATRAIPPCKTKTEYAKAADAILKRSRCDAITGARKDHEYRRKKRAESRRLARHWRKKTRKLGKLGPASPVKRIDMEKA